MAAAGLDYYSIFCGVFLYQEKISSADQVWSPWTSRLKDPEGYTTHLRRTYYETYLHSIVPEVMAPPSIEDVRHYTQSGIVSGKTSIRAVIKDREFKVSYIDVLLFPGQIGIYLFKVGPADDQPVTPEQISAVLSFFRSQGSKIMVDHMPHAVEKYLFEFLSSAVRLAPYWDKFSPQLKSYSVINEVNGSAFTPEHDILLFELSNALPIGTYGRTPRAPSTAFFEKTFNENCTSIFSNWKALSLFDSFTRLCVGSPDPFATWEIDFFNIYILSLYTKYQLYYFNSQLTNVVKVSRATHRLKTSFIEFVNDHNHAYISYKFLPNELYEQMRSSLAIQKEVDQIELKSSRLSEAYSDQKSRQLNLLILVLSMMSVISVLTDISEWFSRMGVPESAVYSVPFAGLVIAVPIAIYFLVRRRGGRE